MNARIDLHWLSSEKQLDRGVIAGAALCLVVIAVGIVAGGQYGNFIDPASLVIVLGGTVAATLVHFPLYDLVQSKEALRNILISPPNHALERIGDLVRMAQTVRRTGLLSLEQEARGAGDEFLRKALEITVDGQAADDVKRILETEIRSSNDRAGRAVQVFQTMGNYSPALGLIGTLIGLIQMLSSLDNPATVGPSMSVALITTFYGAILANLFFLPIAGKIKNRAEEESLVKAITVEGVLALGRQENPLVVEQRLQSFLPLVAR